MGEAFPNRRTIVTRQLERFHALCSALVPANSFYTKKFASVGSPRRIQSLEQFAEIFPFTTKAEITEDQRASPPFGTNLTYPVERYSRYHQTSGTAGVPLRWLDTEESWQWMLRNWEQILRVARVKRADRVFFAFSFGPFIGFWLAFEAAAKIGCLCVPGGGMSTIARVRQVLDMRATVLCCTPTYAIHMGETAAKETLNLSRSAVRVIIVAGEPGGSIASTRQQIEQLWPGARVFDHHGMTEVGPVSFECPARPCVLHIIEEAYIPEVIDPTTERVLDRGASGELVLTTLGRTGSPLIRYRTGDLVRTSHEAVCACGRSDLALEGGILGRTDEMVVVRGVNVFPSAVEEIIRNCGGVAEYRVHVKKAGALTELAIEIEPEAGAADPDALAGKVERAFQQMLSLRVSVRAVATLPRFEMKAKRWVDEA